MKKLPVNKVVNFVAELLQNSGLNQELAAQAAQALVDADAKGVTSHGVMRVPIYCERLISGAVNSNLEPTLIAGGRSLEQWDGHNGFGISLAFFGVNRAIQLASDYGIGCVAVRRSNHFGMAGTYTEYAAKKGMIGIAMTNVKPFIVAPGGKKPVVGNNPLAISLPGSESAAFNLDLAFSVAAAGKISAAIKRGESIPSDWATDKEGLPTTDPKEAFVGFLQPMAGHKGLGLAYAVDALTGLLSGGSWQYGVRSMYENPDLPSETAHLFIAINPKHINDEDTWCENVENFRENIINTPTHFGRHVLPGDIEEANKIKSLNSGIEIPDQVCVELENLASKLGVNIPW